MAASSQDLEELCLALVRSAEGEPSPLANKMATAADLYPAESEATMELEDSQAPEAAPLVKSVRIKLDQDPLASPSSSSTKMTEPPSWTDSARSNMSLRSNASSASSDRAAPGLRDNLMRRQRKDRNPMA